LKRGSAVGTGIIMLGPAAANIILRVTIPSRALIWPLLCNAEKMLFF